MDLRCFLEAVAYCSAAQLIWWLAAWPRSGPIRARSWFVGRGVVQRFGRQRQQGGSGWTRLEVEVEEGWLM
jgi:hypothetical protein